jgi:hypothetical protein
VTTSTKSDHLPVAGSASRPVGAGRRKPVPRRRLRLARGLAPRVEAQRRPLDSWTAAPKSVSPSGYRQVTDNVGWWARLALGAVVISCLAMAGAIAMGALLMALAVFAIAKGLAKPLRRKV